MTTTDPTAMNLTDLKKEAAELAAKLKRERVEEDKLTTLAESLAADHLEASAGTPGTGMISQRSVELGARRGEVSVRLRDIRSAREWDQPRLRKLTAIIEAGPREEAAVATLHAATEALDNINRRHEKHSASVDQLRAMKGRGSAHKTAYLQNRAARLLAAVGLREAPPAEDATVLDLGEALAIDGALMVAVGSLNELSDQRAAAEKAVSDARDDLEARRGERYAIEAELRHAEALSKYLPSLLRYVATHQVAYGYKPDLPSLTAAIEEAAATTAALDTSDVQP